MTSANDSTNSGSRQKPRYLGFANRVLADLRERFDGVFEFIGLISYFLGGWRQIGLAIALASIAGGLGECLAYSHSSGPGWMGFGGFILGLLLPVPKKQFRD